MTLASWFTRGERGATRKFMIELDSDGYAIPVRSERGALDIARGVVTGHSLWEKFGHNPDVDAAASETIWRAGGDISMLATGAPLRIASTATGDTASGSGARTVQVQGLDSNWAVQQVTYSLAGTATFSTAESWLGVNRVSVETAGSGAVNAGDISATATGGELQGYVAAGEGITHQLVYHIASGEMIVPRLQFFSVVQGGAGSAPLVTLDQVYHNAGGAKRVQSRHDLDTARANVLSIPHDYGPPINGPGRIEYRATTDQNNTGVYGRFHFVQIST